MNYPTPIKKKKKKKNYPTEQSTTTLDYRSSFTDPYGMSPSVKLRDATRFSFKN